MCRLWAFLWLLPGSTALGAGPRPSLIRHEARLLLLQQSMFVVAVAIDAVGIVALLLMGVMLPRSENMTSTLSISIAFVGSSRCACVLTAASGFSRLRYL